ncbi:DUF3380 domain-containing protein [Georhizobium profundi]|uniref:DUF3380 domain-containing protein n=1 Tax=Georhizobium profundi TaxID=2341112 RepID=A0A3Q8XPI2_9HYPH|nr:N-acetylmuramidase domain-containing protein [Georhizobium profundi]AZN72245.1 DUF3380 domain-containing protein [Georhizobium profundi]
MSDWNSFRGAARRLDDIDLPRIGHRIGVGEDELHAFMDVEAAGSGFDRQGRPKMLFEPHVFHRNLTPARRSKAVKAGLAYARWGEKLYPSDSYPRLVEAMAIDETAALKAASWGLGQILGENFAMVGYESPQDMVWAFMEDEEHHLEAIVDFLIGANLDDHLRNHRWEDLARGYNGPGYAKHNYHGRMAAAYAKWAKIADTPWAPAVDTLPPIGVKMVSPGMRGAPVRAIQMRLQLLGHYAGAVDGIFGPVTDAALRSFQRAASIVVDGYAGPQTFAAIDATLSPEPIIVKEEAAMPMPTPAILSGSETAKPAIQVPRPASPVEQSAKAVGAAKWAAIAGALWTAVVAADVLPPAFTTPEFIAAVTAAIGAVAGAVGSYRAPKNAEPG